MQQHHIATIGDGVDVRTSTLPRAGNGLFTTRFIPKNKIITEYVGPILFRQEAEERKRKQQHSHIRAINCQHTYIDGIKKPEFGQGGASFANDGTKTCQNNALFHTRFDHSLGRDRVYLKATRDLQPHTEVFVSYGRTYWEDEDVDGDDPDRAADGNHMQQQQDSTHEQDDKQQQPQQQQQQPQDPCVTQTPPPSSLPQQQQLVLRQQQPEVLLPSAAAAAAAAVAAASEPTPDSGGGGGATAAAWLPALQTSTPAAPAPAAAAAAADMSVASGIAEERQASKLSSTQPQQSVAVAMAAGPQGFCNSSTKPQLPAASAVPVGVSSSRTAHIAETKRSSSGSGRSHSSKPSDWQQPEDTMLEVAAAVADTVRPVSSSEPVPAVGPTCQDFQSLSAAEAEAEATGAATAAGGAELQQELVQQQFSCSKRARSAVLSLERSQRRRQRRRLLQQSIVVEDDITPLCNADSTYTAVLPLMPGTAAAAAAAAAAETGTFAPAAPVAEVAIAQVAGDREYAWMGEMAAAAPTDQHGVSADCGPVGAETAAPAAAVAAPPPSVTAVAAYAADASAATIGHHLGVDDDSSWFGAGGVDWLLEEDLQGIELGAARAAVQIVQGLTGCCEVEC